MLLENKAVLPLKKGEEKTELVTQKNKIIESTEFVFKFLCEIVSLRHPLSLSEHPSSDSKALHVPE